MFATELMPIILTLAVGMGAGFVQRVSGFGLGIFAMMFMPYFMPNHTAASTISCIFSCGTSTYNALKYKKHIPFKVIIPLIFSSLIVIPIAVRFSAVVSAKIFEIILGVVLICLSIYFLAFDNCITVKPNLKNSLTAGAIGGSLNGLFSTGGPPIVIYLSQAIPEKIIYFSGIQFYFAVTNIYAMIFRIINKMVTKEMILYAVVGFCGCMIGNVIGGCVFDKLDAAKLKKVIYVGMIVSGVAMLF